MNIILFILYVLMIKREFSKEESTVLGSGKDSTTLKIISSTRTSNFHTREFPLS